MRTVSDLAWRFALATLLVFVGTMVLGGIVFAILGNPLADTPAPGDVFVPMLISSALLVAALVAPVRLSALSRWPRIAAVFAACFGVNVLLMQVEAAAFLDLSPAQLLAAFVNATFNAAWLSLVTGYLFGARDGRQAVPPTFDGMIRKSWILRIAGAGAAYLLLYLVAGMLIYPKVQAYYESQNFEAGLWMFPLAFVRGMLYVLFSLWLLRSLRCTRLPCAIAIAFMFPVLAGVAALIVPSGFMPPDVRFWHALEVGWSNAAFGFLVGWLFWRPLSPPSPGK